MDYKSSQMPQMLKFLLVEDNESHAILIKRQLEQFRVANEIMLATDGEQALQILNREGEYKDYSLPDIILLDLKLPKLNGHEVLASIKSNSELKRIPVVMLTTSDNDSDLKKAYDNHVNSYLVKPINFDSFRNMVKDLSFYWGIWNKTNDN